MNLSWSRPYYIRNGIRIEDANGRIVLTGTCKLDTDADYLVHKQSKPVSDERILELMAEYRFGFWMIDEQFKKVMRFRNQDVRAMINAVRQIIKEADDGKF